MSESYTLTDDSQHRVGTASTANTDARAQCLRWLSSHRHVRVGVLDCGCRVRGPAAGVPGYSPLHLVNGLAS